MPRASTDNPLIPRPELAVLAGLLRPGAEQADARPLEELARLADTAGAVVGGMLTQKATRVKSKTYIGTGKVGELRELADRLGADIVIFDDDLSPAQAHNLEKAVGRRVVDRTELILDIFASHAHTAAARIQVELAQLEYSLPRLKRLWAHLGRIRGGIGLRGPGEQQLEEDKRLIARRIGDLKRKLARIEKRKKREVGARRQAFNACLVGYTNAGKSTLMNALTGVGVPESDKLFATLDTKTCLWDVGHKKKVLLSDTVGFIRNTPHHLIASFHATLEEATQADLLLHVVDAAAAEPLALIRAVEGVLKDLGCEKKPTLLCLNKSDLVRDRVEVEYLNGLYPESVELSARTGAGLAGLTRKVYGILDEAFETLDVTVNPSDGRLLAEISRRGDVLYQKLVDGRLHITVRLEAPDAGRLLKKPGVQLVRPGRDDDDDRS